MANNSFNVVGLDFDQTKQSLKSYLSTQDTLKDYNFDGSVLNTILDVMAYNTHYQAFYSNMIANEMFLDSALMRPSVVSHAKTLGYVTGSKRAATATLTITAASGNPDQFLSYASEFIGTDSAKVPYRFVLLDTIYSNSEGVFENVEVKEGTLRRITYVYDPIKKNLNTLLLPNDKIDTSTIRVRVQASVVDQTGLTDIWTQAESYIDLTPTSKVYFLQEKEAGMYELYFGDNFLGVQPTAGNVVIIDYLETNGEMANGITDFTAVVGGLNTPVVVSQSSGGAAEESVAKIKFLAPKYYQSGGRAVTEEDYRVAVMREYPNTDSVLVYGGETTNPPQYGKVFIAVKPNSGDALTTSEKYALAKTLRTKSSVVSIIPEIVDADFIDIIVNTIITYDPTILAYSTGTLKAVIVAYLFGYSAQALQSFGDNLYTSKISDGINALDTSILSNETTISLRKSIDLSKFSASKGFSLTYMNPIKELAEGGAVTSSLITHKNTQNTIVYNCRLQEDGMGNLNVTSTDATTNTTTIIYPSVGTVEYNNGKITFNSKFLPIISTTSQQYLTITIMPKNADLFVFENKIFRISGVYSDSVSVNMIPYEKRKETITL